MTSRQKTLLVGFAAISSVFIAIIFLWAGSTFLDNWLGDMFRFLAGIMSTPVFMESILAIAGLFIVLILNSYRRLKDAEDEYIHPDDIKKRSSRDES